MNILALKVRDGKENITKGKMTELKKIVSTIIKKQELKGKISQYKNFITKGTVIGLPDGVIVAKIKNNSSPTFKKAHLTIVSNINKKPIIIKEKNK